jgi:hypothetical protein
MNDFADRERDRHVERTKNRPLAARLISPKARAARRGTDGAGFSPRAVNCSPSSSAVVLALAVIYPFLKRVSAAAGTVRNAFGFGIRWRSPPTRADRRLQAAAQNIFGRLRMTPNMRWSTAMTTSFGKAVGDIVRRLTLRP